MLSRIVRLARRVWRALAAVARFAPTRRLALVVLVASPVWLLSENRIGEGIAAAVTCVVALAALIDALRIPGRDVLDLTRDVAPRIPLEESRDLTVTIRSRWPRAVLASVTQRPAPTIRVMPATTPVLSIPAGGERAFTATLTPGARGVFPLGPVAIAAVGPWGLVRRSLIWSLSDTIDVIPAIAGTGRYRLLAAQHRVRSAGQRAIRRRGAGTNFSRLREYVPGDDPRHIDWKSTARHGRLVSREYSVEQGQTVVIAVDAGRMMTQLAGDRPRFEYAVTAALTLADVAYSSGDRVGLLVFDDVVRRYVAPSHDPGTVGAIRDALIGVTPTLTEPDYAAAFRTLVERNRRRSLIVLFTDVVDVRSSRALIALTARSAERHLPLVVALRNEQLVRAAVPHAGESEAQAYESAAAEELLAAREGVLQSMRQAGVAVLDVAPTVMTAALVNRYLEIKQRSAL